jgi:hypothetical protein
LTTETDKKAEILEKLNLTDTELDDLLKQMMKAKGYKKFINYKGEEEELK